MNNCNKLKIVLVFFFYFTLLKLRIVFIRCISRGGLKISTKSIIFNELDRISFSTVYNYHEGRQILRRLYLHVRQRFPGRHTNNITTKK